ncbi:MAG: carboxypeptidase regulatory-like protein [Hymenobacter sp.]|nr:carboxypeptidase regulatory-like protein [Hymenobacter sp.]
MKNRLHLLALGLALGAGLLGSACSKKTQDTPTPAEVPAPPSITGLIQPADAVLGVAVIDDNTHQTIVGVAPDSKGAYRFETMPAGTYSLHFNAKRGYVPPREQSVTVTAGKTTVVPTVTVVQSTVAFTIDGVAAAPASIDLMLLFSPKNFDLIFSNGTLGATPDSYVLRLSMPSALAVGTYSLNGTPAFATFTGADLVTYDSRVGTPTAPAGGTLTITSVFNVPPYPRYASGTFSFTGRAAAAAGSKTITGTFSDISY